MISNFVLVIHKTKAKFGTHSTSTANFRAALSRSCLKDEFKVQNFEEIQCDKIPDFTPDFCLYS